MTQQGRPEASAEADGSSIGNAVHTHRYHNLAGRAMFAQDSSTARDRQISHDSCFEFELVGRTMTARYSMRGQLHATRPFTKADLEALLTGYPPLYRETEWLSDGSAVRNPIRVEQDLEGAGWILHCGLSHLRRRSGMATPTACLHAMHVETKETGKFWTRTTM